MVGARILLVGITAFLLHLIINDRGELLAFKLTPGNTDDRQPVPELTQDLIGKLFGGLLRSAFGSAAISLKNYLKSFMKKVYS